MWEIMFTVMLMYIVAGKWWTCHLVNLMLTEIYGERTEWQSYVILLLFKSYLLVTFQFTEQEIHPVKSHIMMRFCFQFLRIRKGNMLTKEDRYKTKTCFSTWLWDRSNVVDDFFVNKKWVNWTYSLQLNRSR